MISMFFNEEKPWKTVNLWTIYVHLFSLCFNLNDFAPQKSWAVRFVNTSPHVIFVAYLLLLVLFVFISVMLPPASTTNIWAIYEINPQPDCFGHFFRLRSALLFTTFWGWLLGGRKGRYKLPRIIAAPVMTQPWPFYFSGGGHLCHLWKGNMFTNPKKFTNRLARRR